jgi:hypothetical protein
MDERRPADRTTRPRSGCTRVIPAATLIGVAIACGGTNLDSPAAPTPVLEAAGPAPAPSPSPSPTPAPTPPPGTSFSIDMPLLAGDAANDSGGLTPFGVHLADHGVDGHPGWDIEYRIGGLVRAAADGTVQTVMVPDAARPTRHVVQVMHQIGSRSFRTVYFGVDSPRPEIVVNASIRRGDVIGAAGVLTQMIGTGLVTSAGIHFQVDDFSYSGGLTNRNAVNPELWLSSSGRAVFEPIWEGASYTGELTEPFPSNPRDVVFPLTRRWTRQSGDLAETIELTRATGTTNEFSYRLIDFSGAAVDSGAVRVVAWSQPFTTIDLLPSSGGPARLGLYDVVSNRLRLVLGAPGAPRPGSFAGESVYTTTGSSSM